MAMTITYRVGGGLYVNLTNRCPCSCVFCLRTHGDGVYGSDSLWLDREPTAAEVIAALRGQDLGGVREVVFCGYGEPTERLDVLMEAAAYLKGLPAPPRIRVNTNGLSDLVNGRPTAADFSGRVDCVSISLNTDDPAEYERTCRPRFGAAAYPAMLEFAKSVRRYVPEVVMTVVGEPVTSPGSQARCRAICDSIGARLRVRPYEPLVSASEAATRIIAGGSITREEALDLLANAPREELYEAAHRVTVALSDRRFDFCSIVNARCGRCPEDCKWCAQSAHWKTGVETHGWIGTEGCVAAAERSEAMGAGRIGIVTSGRAQTPRQIDELCDALREMRRRTRIHLCGSLGIVGEDDLRRLKEAGLESLHCNLETAPSRFGDLCTTHTQAEKVETLRAAKRVGLDVCCGGIIGMGETDEQLVEFAFAVAEIEPRSIPVNILRPVAGTPLGGSRVLGEGRILDAIAILRLVNPRTALRFAGGRTQLSDDGARKAVRVGINAGIAGPMLTTPGPNYADDRSLAEEAGYEVGQSLRKGEPS